MLKILSGTPSLSEVQLILNKPGRKFIELTCFLRHLIQILTTCTCFIVSNVQIKRFICNGIRLFIRYINQSKLPIYFLNVKGSILDDLFLVITNITRYHYTLHE